jgi:hypothetical protein
MRPKRQTLPLVVKREDRESLALWKEQLQKIQHGAEVETGKRVQRMAASERTKFNRFLRNIEFLGDVGKAARKSRVSRELLDKWMETPGVSWSINMAENKARLMLHCANTAEDVLFRTKVVPELTQDAEIFGSTGQRERESKVIAKLAAQNLKAHRWDIAQAANNNDKGFFIDLGRILSGEISGEFNYDKIDYVIAEICTANPGISTGAVRMELKKRCYSVKEQTIRTRKMRMGLTKRQAANCDKT